MQNQSGVGGIIHNTKQKPSKTKYPKSKKKKKKTWNGCGAENRGLKGGGLWLPQGGTPQPWQNTASGLPTQHPRALAEAQGSLRGESLTGKRTFGTKQPSHREPHFSEILSLLLV